MRVFVTGGSGFVGQRLIRALVARGDTVRALARTVRAAAAVSAAGAEPVAGDLSEPLALRVGLRGCALALHVAAKVDDWGRRADFERINVAGTDAVLAAARAAGTGRVVHVSTEAVCCDGRPIVDADETRPRAEPGQAIGLYAASKAAAEERVLAAVAAGQDAVIVRPRFVWGRGDPTLLPRMAAQVRAGRWVWFDGGRYLTSTCHVDNVCEGTLAAAAHGRPGEIYYLTDGPPVEFRAFITALFGTQGLDPGDRSLPSDVMYAVAWASEGAWRALPLLPGGPPLTRMAVLLVGREVTVRDEKARNTLGYRSSKAREEGLRELDAPASDPE